ncbi:MAG: DUF1015 domain-containing protein [Firmicutes bacterium]|nr:DUF1015 domain-containing protein [Bacillota bacterium]
MAVLRAFRAVRPDKKYAANVISLPYDVMNRQEAARMAEGNPYSFLHVCRSEIDLPEVEDVYAEIVYEKAKENIEGYLAKGVFIRDEKPMLYIYRQITDGRVQTGIVGCVSIDEYEDGTIKEHEDTRIEKELDRIHHFDVCNANTEPVFLAYKQNLRVKTLVEGWISNHEPEYDFVDRFGVEHILWKIDHDETVWNLEELFRQMPELYIADGHHRSASAHKVGLKRRGRNRSYDGNEEFNYFMAVVFPDEDLKIFAYNRVVRSLNGYTPEELLRKIEEAGFIVKEIGEIGHEPEKEHIFTMYLGGLWYKLTAKPEIIPDDITASIDVSILQDSVLKPILGIEDPRADKKIDFVGGIKGLKELERRCKLDAKLAFAAYPVHISKLIEVADAGLRMPPKSTWFEPKLGSGLFMHEI